MHLSKQPSPARMQRVQLQHAYMDVDADGAYIQRDVQEVAALLSLPVSRAANLLRRAKRDIPLVADAEPIEVQTRRAGSCVCRQQVMLIHRVCVWHM